MVFYYLWFFFVCFFLGGGYFHTPYLLYIHRTLLYYGQMKFTKYCILYHMNLVIHIPIKQYILWRVVPVWRPAQLVLCRIAVPTTPAQIAPWSIHIVNHGRWYAPRLGHHFTASHSIGLGNKYISVKHKFSTWVNTPTASLNHCVFYYFSTYRNDALVPFSDFSGPFY